MLISNPKTLDVLKFLNSFLTKENITFFLACLGSAGTLFTGITAYLSSRKKLSAQIIDHAKRRADIYQLFIYIHNDSSIPICISSICLKIANTSFECELLQKKTLFQGDIIV